jgi:hypothetical protein
VKGHQWLAQSNFHREYFRREVMEVMHGVLRPIRRIGGLLGGPVVIVIGLAILVLGWQWRIHTQNLIGTMLPTEGQVVQVVSHPGSKGKVFFYPIVEFRTADGRIIRFEGSTGSNPPAHRVGDQVQVRYDPQSPESAVIDSWDLWLPSILFIGIGGFFVLVGFLFVFDALAALLRLGGLVGLLGFVLLRQRRQ